MLTGILQTRTKCLLVPGDVPGPWVDVADMGFYFCGRDTGQAYHPGRV